MSRKRASLNLSIEAIVILVMAITMLGLGLAFIRSKFTSAGDLLDEVDESVKEQVQAQLSSSTHKAYIPKTQFELKPGDSEVALVGIRNNLPAAHDFEINIKHSDDTIGDCPPGDLCGEVKFTFSPTYDNVGPGESQLVPVKIYMEGTSKKSELFLFVVTYDGGAESYTTKQFFVKGI